MGLLTDLKEQYDLEYQILVNPEPTTRTDQGRYTYYDGSIGKALPFIVVKSKLAHVGNIMQGLNGTLISSNIVRHLELNTELCSEAYGCKCVPPTVLYMKDTKKFYNVSIPLYTEMYINTLFTNNSNALSILNQIREICETASDEAVATYNKAYNFMQPEHPNPNHVVKVMTLEELENYCRETVPDYDLQKENFVNIKIDEVNSGKSLTQLATGFELVEWIIEKSEITDPMVVFGLMAPYVPAVNNHYFENFDREGMIALVQQELDKFDLEIDVVPYFMGLSDNSYISCVDPTDDLEALKSMITPKQVYYPTLKEAEYIAMPSIIVGPWGKDYHTISERVYLPDLEVHTPAIVRRIITEL